MTKAASTTTATITVTLPGKFADWLEGTGAGQGSNADPAEKRLGEIYAAGARKNAGRGYTLALTFTVGADFDAWDYLLDLVEMVEREFKDDPALQRAARTVQERVAALEPMPEPEEAPQSAPAVPARKTTKAVKGATDMVIRWLHKPTGGDSWTEVWESILHGSVEDFRVHASRVLSDKGLGKKTLETADWIEVYQEFHGTPEPSMKAEPERPTTGVLWGYGRVSTKDQDVKLQRDALMAAGCAPDRIYEEKKSGKTVEGREALAAVLKWATPGDTVVVWKLDRLGRSTLDILKIAEDLHARGIGLRVLTGKLAGSYSPNGEGKFFFVIMAAFAELERDLIRERTLAGLEAARSEGRVGGRPSVITDDVMTLALAKRAKGQKVVDIAKELKVSKSALYRALAEAGDLASQALIGAVGLADGR
jgi:DNA invertase Pin-like site-specific DNA recombinase